MKKIAVIGAGFSGLATAWHLLEHPCSVTLFSDGKEASKIAAGLLHKYVGLRANLNPLASVAEKKTLQLLKLAEDAIKAPVIISKGILRVALTDQQKKDYYQCASQNEDVEWLDPRTLIPSLPHDSGIFIHSGMTVDTESYLEGLFLACQSKGLLFEKKHISDLRELDGFDLIIAATGAYPLLDMKFHALKGQLLELEWPSELVPLPFAITSQVYIAMTKDNKRCIVGATYEHDFKEEAPELEKAINELYPKALELYPPLMGAKVLDVKAALRCTTPNRLPFAGHLRDNIYAIIGMGSRGLLYHAYFAEQLVNQLDL